MKTLLLSSLTQAINATLQLDAESQARLQKLQGKVVTIELQPLQWVFQCTFTDGNMRLQEGNHLISETTIRGTPLQLLGVAMAKEDRQRFFAEDVVIEGNAELGQEIMGLFDNLQIDIEEPLSRLVGDVPAYHVGRFMNRMKEWWKDTNTRFTQDVSDYIHEEKEWLPAREALQDFFRDIDTLRMDVDRLEARLLNEKESL